MKSIDFLSFGSVYLDINSFDFPHHDQLVSETETVGSAYQFMIGGSAAISNLQAATLGLNTVFVGKTGDDHPANILTESFTKHNIKSQLIRAKNFQTNISINYISPSGRCIMTTIGNSNQSLSSQDLETHLDPLLKNVKVLYLGSVFKLSQLKSYYPKVIRKANKHQTQIFLDHGRITNVVTQSDLDNMRRLVSQVDYYTPSLDEARVVWGNYPKKELLLKIHQKCPKTTIIITDSTRGSVGITPQGDRHLSLAKNIPILNTVGAGDCFNAAVTMGFLKHRNLKDVLQFAQRVAEYKIQYNRYPTTKDVSL